MWRGLENTDEYGCMCIRNSLSVTSDLCQLASTLTIDAHRLLAGDHSTLLRSHSLRPQVIRHIVDEQVRGLKVVDADAFLFATTVGHCQRSSLITCHVDLANWCYFIHYLSIIIIRDYQATIRQYHRHSAFVSLICRGFACWQPAIPVDQS